MSEAQDYIDRSNAAFALGYTVEKEDYQYRAYCLADSGVSAVGQTPSLAISNCCKAVVAEIENGREFTIPEEKPVFPNQPTYLSESGVLRFVANPIVRYLLDAGPFDLNSLSVVPGFTDDDWSQFAQLIGYSWSGWGSLSYVSNANYHSIPGIGREPKTFQEGFEAGFRSAIETLESHERGDYDG